MRLFLALLVTLHAACAFGQSRTSALSISGSVVDPSNASVAGAKVTLRKAGEAAPRLATADASGAFRFDAPAAGDYEIEIRHEGFQPWKSRIRVGGRFPRLKSLMTYLD